MPSTGGLYVWTPSRPVTASQGERTSEERQLLQQRDRKHSFSSLKGAQTFVPFLVSWQKWENSPASQELVDLPGDEGRGYSKTAELGSFLGGLLPGVPERDGAQTQGRVRARQPRAGGHPLSMPGEGRVGRGGRGD